MYQRSHHPVEVDPYGKVGNPVPPSAFKISPVSAFYQQTSHHRRSLPDPPELSPDLAVVAIARFFPTTRHLTVVQFVLRSPRGLVTFTTIVCLSLLSSPVSLELERFPKIGGTRKHRRDRWH